MTRALSTAILTAGILCASAVVIGQTKYGVTVATVRPAALATVRTYTWTKGRPSFNKTVDAMIVAAVDRQLATRGFTKVSSGPNDVFVSYASLSRIDVDLKNMPAQGAAPTLDVGTLIVEITESMNRQVLYRVRTDTPFTRDRATIEAEVDAAVAAMFAKYPPRTKP